MTAFLKIDDCKTCHRSLPWAWLPAVLLGGKSLSGTGVWRSQLTDGLCPACVDARESAQQQKQYALARRRELVQLLGGEKPYQEFNFERFDVTPDNQLAYERSRHFNPSIINLYLWRPCVVGKTHLAWATARRCHEETHSATLLPAWQLGRRVRMKEPDQEHAAIDQFVKTDVLVLDDLGAGPDTAFGRQ